MLALLPTAATKILDTLDVEKITLEIQQMKGGNGSTKSVKSGSGDSTSLPETIGLTDEDGRSMISASESGIHASQITVPPVTQTSDGGEQAQPEKPKKSKRQLWGDVTISCKCRVVDYIRAQEKKRLMAVRSNNKGLHSHVHPCPPDHAHAYPT